MMMAYYDFPKETTITGVTIMLDTYWYSESLATNGEDFCEYYGCTVEGGEFIVTLRDTSNVFAETFDVADYIVESDFMLITEEDVENGYVTVEFDEPVTLSPNAYYAAVEMYSNSENNNIITIVISTEAILTISIQQ